MKTLSDRLLNWTVVFNTLTTYDVRTCTYELVLVVYGVADAVYMELVAEAHIIQEL